MTNSQQSLFPLGAVEPSEQKSLETIEPVAKARRGDDRESKRTRRATFKDAPRPPDRIARSVVDAVSPTSYSQTEVAERYLSVRQVADRFSVSPQTVWRRTKECKGFPAPIILSPGTTRWRFSDLVIFERSFAEGVR